jgi:hypothetical protein
MSGASPVGVAEGLALEVGMAGGDVIVLCSCAVVELLSVVVVLSLHPQNRPGVKQVVLVLVAVGVVVEEVVDVVVVLVSVLSLHPNQPLFCKVSKLCLLVNCRLQTTYGVWQVVVDDVGVVVVVVDEVAVPVVVVVSSRQPHQPLDRC